MLPSFLRGGSVAVLGAPAGDVVAVAMPRESEVGKTRVNLQMARPRSMVQQSKFARRVSHQKSAALEMEHVIRLIVDRRHRHFILRRRFAGLPSWEIPPPGSDHFDEGDSPHYYILLSNKLMQITGLRLMLCNFCCLLWDFDKLWIVWKLAVVDTTLR